MFDAHFNSPCELRGAVKVGNSSCTGQTLQLDPKCGRGWKGNDFLGSIWTVSRAEPAASGSKLLISEPSLIASVMRKQETGCSECKYYHYFGLTWLNLPYILFLFNPALSSSLVTRINVESHIELSRFPHSTFFMKKKQKKNVLIFSLLSLG